MDWTGMEREQPSGGGWRALLVRCAVTMMAVVATLLLIASLSGSASASDEPGAGSPNAPVLQTERPAEQEADEPRGLVIVAVDPQGPAAVGGLSRGDILLTVDGAEVDTFDQLWEAITSHEPGDVVSLGVTHGDEARTLSVTLGERDGRAYLGAKPWAKGPAAGCGGVVAFAAEPLSGTLDLKLAEPFSGTLEHCAIKPPFGVPGVFHVRPDLDLPAGTSAVVVDGVIEGGPAASAGIEDGTIITAIDGAPIESPDAIDQLQSSRQPGDTVTLTVRKPGQESEETVTVTLGEDPERAGAATVGIKHFHVFINKEVGAGPEGFEQLRELFSCPEEAEEEHEGEILCIAIPEEGGEGMVLKRGPLLKRAPGLPRMLEQVAPSEGSI